MRIYSAFGLTVASEIELTGLPVSSGKPDVRISIGAVEDALTEVKHQGVLFQAAPGKFLLNIKNVARYLVIDGEKIIIQPAKKDQLDDIEVFLTGSVFGALLFQRGMYAFHGSGLSYKNSGIIISGKSGAGKSTLSATLIKNGLSLLADDLCAIAASVDNVPLLFPGIQYIKLWKDAMNKLSLDINDQRKVRKSIDKYIIPVELTAHDPVPVKWVFVIQTRNTKPVEIEEIKGFAKLQLLRSNTFRYQFIKGLDMEQTHFDAMGLVGRYARIFKIFRPQSGFHAEEMAKVILSILSSEQ